MNATASANYNIKVTDVTGRVIYQTEVSLTANAEQRITLSLENYSSGMYMLSVENNGVIKRMKLIKE